jgi:hypothetical protein
VNGADLNPYLAQYGAARRTKGFEASIASALRDLLLAPDFLFRLEFAPPGAVPGSLHPVSDFELASRLSFLLWSTIPDDDLLDAARDGGLHDPSALNQQLRRMLADPRASALADNFAEQWLGLRGLSEVKPDKAAYPDYDGALAAGFEEETRLFVRSVFRQNRSVLDLINADYSYLNERLAKAYGIPGVIGPGFRRVSLASHPERGGLLGQGSILLLTSHSTKTSPILRGKWILESLLNSPPPPPPPGVPPLDDNAPDAKKLTLRQQIERHRKDPMCGACHARMDPLGFALENFDVIGRWRTRDGEGDIDASAKLPNGAAFIGPQGLKKHLLDRKEQFAGAAVSRLLTYALGRQLDMRDQPTVRRILRECEGGGYRFADLVAAIVHSTPFQMRQAQGSSREAP